MQSKKAIVGLVLAERLVSVFDGFNITYADECQSIIIGSVRMLSGLEDGISLTAIIDSGCPKAYAARRYFIHSRITIELKLPNQHSMIKMVLSQALDALALQMPTTPSLSARKAVSRSYAGHFANFRVAKTS
jgi:hypothetical protein